MDKLFVKEIGFFFSDDNQLLMTYKLANNECSEIMTTSEVKLIRYHMNYYAEVFTNDCIYTIKNKDWELIRFLNDANAYRDKIEWITN